jgi:N-acetylglutamate synthase-like GNAT family acetyltransferase
MNAPKPELRPALRANMPAVLALLGKCGLPSSDLTADSDVSFLLAEWNGRIVGVAGTQLASPFALLRSVAVAADCRGLGTARQLISACEADARKYGVSALYLIANDDAATSVFRHLGYTAVERKDVPSAVQSLSEFTHLCPQSNACLRKVLISNFTEVSPMKKLEVFDPAMCCSTGVCGVEVDPVLAQFAADLKWVGEHGIEVSRHNLGQEPQAFAANPAVLKEMEAGMDRLPVIIVDGHIVSTGMYPSRQQLAQKLGVSLTSTAMPPLKAAPCCTPKSGCC